MEVRMNTQEILQVPTTELFVEILNNGGKLMNDRYMNPFELVNLCIRYLLVHTENDAKGIADYLYKYVKNWNRGYGDEEPPFEEDEFLRNVTFQFDKEVCLARANMPKADGSKPLIGKNLNKFMSAIDIKAPLVEGVISRGELVMFFAPSGIGKSSFTQSLCVYASIGKPVFDLYEVPQPVKCLYLNLEMTDAEVGVRFESMFEALGASAENFEVDSLLDFDITRQEDRQRLLATAQIKKPDIVVLDPLEAMHHKDENSATEMALVIKPLRELAHMFNCGIVIVHHTGAARYDNRGRLLPKRIRGSSVIEDKMDNVIEIIETDDADTKRLHFTKTRSVITTRRADPLFEFDWQTYLVRLSDDVKMRERYASLSIERHKKIEPLLKLLAKGLSTRQIADYAGVNHSTIIRWKTGIREPSEEHIQKLAQMLQEN
jgi:transposase